MFVSINSGGNGRADLPLAILFGRIWRSSRSLSRLLLHDHLGFATFSRRIDCKRREIKRSRTRDFI